MPSPLAIFLTSTVLPSLCNTGGYFGNEFILVFRHKDGHKVASPEQAQVWMKQTMGWIGVIAAQNKFIHGHELAFDDAKVLKHKHAVTNEPFGGYIIVKAGQLKMLWNLPARQ